MTLFGRYIHHFPYTGVFGNEDEAKQNLRYERSRNFISQIKNS
jgi:hypothetical protein